jgi:DNA-binding CsgD family transcriptional regulator
MKERVSRAERPSTGADAHETLPFTVRADGESGPAVSTQASVLELTLRQRQVLALLARGNTAGEIGTALGISGRTARAHLDVLRQKLGVTRARDLPGRFRDLTGFDALSVS